MRDAASMISFEVPAGDADGDPRRRGRRVERRQRQPQSCGPPSRSAACNELTGWAIANGVELERLEVKRPSLEDVYLELTGTEAGS